MIKKLNLDAFIVTNPTNIFYLTGFKGIAPQEREAILICQGATLIDFKAILIAPQLYQNEARRLGSRKLKIKIVRERDQILEQVKDLLKRAKKVGFEENDLKYSEYQEFLSNLSKPGLEQVDKPGLELVPFKNLVEDLRATKTQDEIRKIEKAQIISQKAFAQLLKTLKIGQTEEEIAQVLSKIIKSLGGQGLAFTPIVASGPNSAKPHHETGNRRLAINDTLLLDFGAKYQNYCADLSRTIFIGKATDQQKNIYLHVLNAQKAALNKITHGLKTSDAYHATNNYFRKHRLHRYFIHGLGHGVGLEVHEKPYLRPHTRARLGKARQAGLDSKEQDETLLENMVFSVEPGLYFPWGGVRIEDLVVVKNARTKVLGNNTPELIEL